MTKQYDVCILGATGSIGVSTLDVVARHPHLYKVVALTANTNITDLYEQCVTHHPEFVVVVNEAKAEEFKVQIANSPIADIKVLTGASALETVTTLDNVHSVIFQYYGLNLNLDPVNILQEK